MGYHMSLDYMTACAYINGLNGDIPEVKRELAKIFKDKTIPLEKRWDLFMKTPNLFKEHDLYTLKLLDFEISWYDDFHQDRYKDLTISEFMEIVNDNRSDGGIHQEIYERLDEVKEFFLSKNLGSWTEDW